MAALIKPEEPRTSGSRSGNSQAPSNIYANAFGATFSSAPRCVTLINMGAILVLLLTTGGLFADSIPRDEYRARRAELRKSLDGVMVLFGANESEDFLNAFIQEPNFLYLTGWREP